MLRPAEIRPGQPAFCPHRRHRWEKDIKQNCDSRRGDQKRNHDPPAVEVERRPQIDFLKRRRVLRDRCLDHRR